MRLIVHDTPEDTSRAVAERIAGLAREADDRFTLGLSGGTTPAPAYRILAGTDLDWDRIDLWVSDERWVPWDHERSNGRMAMDVLAGPVGARLLRPPYGDGTDPDRSAAGYEEMLRQVLDDRRPDVIHLGMGDDGHTASLFPGTQALEEWHRWVVANWVPEQSEFRITSTYPLIWSARVVIVQAHGAGKAAALRDSFAGLTPAGKLGGGDAAVEWHVDRAAASLLD
ncbi:MAG: 6-phosphogluconolactonase [Actinomycetes bacterium]|nr:MAG: 6-phosphogluconolactonase [Actinomycetota bacterium]